MLEGAVLLDCMPLRPVVCDSLNPGEDIGCEGEVIGWEGDKPVLLDTKGSTAYAADGT